MSARVYGWRGSVKTRGRRPLLDDLAQVHHGDPLAQVPDGRQVVGDEQVADAVRALEVLQQVHDLGADRDVEGRDRLVEDDHAGIERERPGDRDPLALAPAELVGKLRAAPGSRPTSARSRATRPAISWRPSVVFSTSGSPTIAPARIRGLSELHGSWNTAWTAARYSRSSVPASPARSRPRNRMAPAVGVSSRSRQRASRGLPAARLADEAERLARVERERDAVHRADDGPDAAAEERRAADREVPGEVADFEERDGALAHDTWRQQLTVWPGASARAGGNSTRHRGSTCGHRGANGQPGADA